MTKVLFIGLGSIGQRHLRNLRHLLGDSVEIIAYRERRTVPMLNDQQEVIENRSISAEYQLREINTLDEALLEKPDIALIANPSSMHVETAIKAAEAGCHLFIEKPLGVQHEGVVELIELVEKRRLVAFVAYQFRFHPGLQKIFRWLQEQRIGKLISAHIVNGEYLPNFHPYEDYRVSYAARKDLGGGCILTQIHEFDYIYWLFGIARRIFSIGGQLSDLELDVEDAVTILMECRFRRAVLPVSLCLNYVQSPPRRTCTIIGTEGRIEWDFLTGRLELQSSESDSVELYDFSYLNRNDLFLFELEHFLQCVSDKSDPLVNLRSGYESLRMALAARASLESGKVQILN